MRWRLKLIPPFLPFNLYPLLEYGWGIKEGWGLWQTGKQTPLHREPLSFSSSYSRHRGMRLSVARFSDFSREAIKQDFDVKTNFFFN